MSPLLVTILVALALVLVAFVSSRRFARHVVTVAAVVVLVATAWWLGSSSSDYVGVGLGAGLQVVGGGLALLFPLTQWGDEAVEWVVACFHGTDPERLRRKREARRLAEREARRHLREREAHRETADPS